MALSALWSETGLSPVELCTSQLAVLPRSPLYRDAGVPPEKAPALLDSLEREKAFYVNILRDDICIDL